MQEGASARKVASYACGTLGVEKARVMLADLAPTARMVGDPAKRTILAWATPQDHAAIEQAVAIMVESEGQGDASLSIYPVSRVTPAEVVPLLKEILPSAQVQAAVDGKRLLVWATADQHRQVEKVVAQIEAGDPRQQDAGPRTYRSRPEVLQKVKGLLLEKAPQAKVLSEDQPGVVLIWASTAEHVEIQKLFDALEKEIPAGDRQFQTYELRKATSAQARELISAAVPSVQYLGSDNPRRLLLRAREADHELIRKTLDELEAALAEPVPQVVRVFDLQEATPALVQSLLDPKLLEGLSVTPDSLRNALIVRGPQEPLQRLGSAITELLGQLPEPKRRAPQSYRLRHADPTTMLAPLQAVFPTVTMTVDAATRSVLATALPEEHTRLAEAVAQLDQPSVTQRVTKAYRLRGSNLSSTRDAIQGLVPKALLSADWSSRMLLVTGTAEEQQQVADVVEQLTRPMDQDRQTKVYTLKVADANAVENAIESMLPTVRAVSDGDTRTVLVTATAEEQTRITDLVQQLDRPAPANRQTQVYRLRQASVRAAQAALQEQFPRATFATDRALRTLLATATAEEQTQIAEVVRQLDQTVASDRQTQVYRLQYGNVGSAEDALLEQFPDASIAADRGNRSLLITATPEVQTRIAEVIRQFDLPGDTNREAKVYRLERADVRSAVEALEDQFSEATIAADPDNRSLLATATKEEHEKIAAIVSQLDKPSATSQETRAYQFRSGDVRAARDALEALLPNATISIDIRNRSLIVTAAADEQQRVADLVPQLDREAAQLPTLVAYKINNVSVASVLDSLQDLYSGNDNVSISADVANGAILAKALPRDQAEISQVIARLENGVTDDTRRRLEAYPLPASDSKAVLDTLTQLFRGKSPAVDISINQQTNQVLAVATPDQHRVLAEAVKQIRGEPTVFEVFALRSVDPFAIQGAIDRLYEGQPQRPWANADGEAQQLFVRGTVEQMKQVRDLLKMMGELPDESQQGMRVIRYRGDVGEALRQLEQAWPGLRSNKMRILRQDPPAQEESSDGSSYDPSSSKPEGEDDGRESSDPAKPKPQGDAMLRRLGELRYVADPANREDDAATKKVVDGQGADAAQEPTGAAVSATTQEEAPPVLILPSDDAITVISDDPEALQQVESMLRTIEQQSTMAGGAGNFSVIPLRNAGARAVSKILEELFKQMPLTQRATLGRVSMVADDRLNAVVVHGRPGDRAVIAELLRVLDSSNIPDSLANTVPQIVQLDYMNAAEARTILRGVYRTQLESGGRRQEMEIPKGVSSEVALLLRQMNASNSGPLLTLEVDDVTNSLVIMAPRQLVDEVATLAKRLDANAQEADRRTVGVVPLQGTNVREIQGALQGLMRSRRSSR
jgi:type II secretory pathway component GspD/PulD (secretin)